jgi:hypothetical protein
MIWTAGRPTFPALNRLSGTAFHFKLPAPPPPPVKKLFHLRPAKWCEWVGEGDQSQKRIKLPSRAHSGCSIVCKAASSSSKEPHDCIPCASLGGGLTIQELTKKFSGCKNSSFCFQEGMKPGRGVRGLHVTSNYLSQSGDSPQR